MAPLLLTAVLGPLALVLALTLAAGCGPGPTPGHGPSRSTGAAGVTFAQARAGGTPGGPVVLLFSGELLGYTAPCGCTAELQDGGIGRLATLARQGGKEASAVVLIDGGDLLTLETPVPAGRMDQELARSEVLLQAAAMLGYDALVPGEIDLALTGGLGPLAARLSRHGLLLLSSNLRAGGPPGELGRAGLLLLSAGRLRLALLGYTEPELLAGSLPAALGEDEASEPWTPSSLAALVQGLRRSGATHVVVIGHAERRTARRLLEQVQGIDFWVQAHGSREIALAEAVGQAWLLEVFSQGRRLGRLDLHPGPTGAAPFRPAHPAVESEEIAAGLRRRLAHLQRLAPADDEGELAQLVEQTRRELVAVEQSPLPGTPGTFHWQQLRVSSDLPAAADIEELHLGFDRRLAELAQRAAKQQQGAVPLPPGEQGFAGAPACGGCHEAELRHWSLTPHAGALERLVENGRQF
ncbi:MAG: hypothetical protein FJ125_04585, partial [Deltaproteobacteria bacterium]|nr:hypothetical protein [Deltaproteobacteria bacterium]